ncbi:MAG TPA: hypothetical protein PK950_00150, partial [Candidatus Paceibacterota bacterium]|nr:hypothetical protein [Candidatus Paceibacterota bacterium]
MKTYLKTVLVLASFAILTNVNSALGATTVDPTEYEKPIVAVKFAKDANGKKIMKNGKPVKLNYASIEDINKEHKNVGQTAWEEDVAKSLTAWAQTRPWGVGYTFTAEQVRKMIKKPGAFVIADAHFKAGERLIRCDSAGHIVFMKVLRENYYGEKEASFVPHMWNDKIPITDTLHGISMICGNTYWPTAPPYGAIETPYEIPEPPPTVTLPAETLYVTKTDTVTKIQYIERTIQAPSQPPIVQQVPMPMNYPPQQMAPMQAYCPPPQPFFRLHVGYQSQQYYQPPPPVYVQPTPTVINNITNIDNTDNSSYYSYYYNDQSVNGSYNDNSQYTSYQQWLHQQWINQTTTTTTTTTTTNPQTPGTVTPHWENPGDGPGLPTIGWPETAENGPGTGSTGSTGGTGVNPTIPPGGDPWNIPGTINGGRLAGSSQPTTQPTAAIPTSNGYTTVMRDDFKDVRADANINTNAPTPKSIGNQMANMNQFTQPNTQPVFTEPAQPSRAKPTPNVNTSNQQSKGEQIRQQMEMQNQMQLKGNQFVDVKNQQPGRGDAKPSNQTPNFTKPNPAP